MSENLSGQHGSADTGTLGLMFRDLFQGSYDFGSVSGILYRDLIFRDLV